MTGPDLRADKKLGQHFLHDRRVLGRIVAALDVPGARGGELVARGVLAAASELPGSIKDVVEIGPGPGALTLALVEAGYRVATVEKDPRWRARMEEIGAANGHRVWVAGEDALTMDWADLLADRQPVVGNLPYNVGTEIVADLVRLPTFGKPGPSVMVFMLQKEVCQRICAKPGTGKNKAAQADWGRLGVLCDLLTEREMLFDVAPGAFNPPPKVMSSVIRLTPLPAPRFEVDMDRLDRVLRAAFGQRRKMLRVSLKGLLDEAQIARVIDPMSRPEIVTTAQFCALAGLVG